jgi:glycerophosphoryl diester phosphodiesterase
MILSQPRIIGHRGAALRAPENTLAGLRKAHELGARWVEFDVQATRDGHPFLLHDARLERTTNGYGIAADRSEAELARLDAGAWFAPAYRGECVPSLGETLELLETLDMGAVVEVKPAPGDGARTMRAALTALAPRPARDALIVSSFDEDALAVARAEAPDLPRALIVKAVPPDWRARTERLGCTALHADQRGLDARTIAVVAPQMPVRAYTVNAPDRAAALFRWGVGAVFTDCPDVLISTLACGTDPLATADSKGSRAK